MLGQEVVHAKTCRDGGILVQGSNFDSRESGRREHATKVVTISRNEGIADSWRTGNAPSEAGLQSIQVAGDFTNKIEFDEFHFILAILRHRHRCADGRHQTHHGTMRRFNFHERADFDPAAFRNSCRSLQID